MATYDPHANFGYSIVAIPPNSGSNSNFQLTLQTGGGSLFPATASGDYNIVVWQTGTNPTITNATILRVANLTGDTFTFTRQAEGSADRIITIGDQVALAITAKTLTDIENNTLNAATGGTVLGNVLIKIASNSTTALHVQYSDGTPVFDVDTVNKAVLVGTETWDSWAKFYVTGGGARFDDDFRFQKVSGDQNVARMGGTGYNLVWLVNNGSYEALRINGDGTMKIGTNAAIPSITMLENSTNTTHGVYIGNTTGSARLDVYSSGFGGPDVIHATIDSSAANQVAILGQDSTNFAYTGDLIKFQLQNATDTGNVVKIIQNGSGKALKINNGTTDTLQIDKAGTITGSTISGSSNTLSNIAGSSLVANPTFNGQPTFGGEQKLMSGNQETGFVGNQIPVASAAGNVGIGCNFKMQMTNIPSGATYNNVASGGFSGEFANNFTLYGCFVGGGASGSNPYYLGTYVTIGN